MTLAAHDMLSVARGTREMGRGCKLDSNEGTDLRRSFAAFDPRGSFWCDFQDFSKVLRLFFFFVFFKSDFCLLFKTKIELTCADRFCFQLSNTHYAQ